MQRMHKRMSVTRNKKGKILKYFSVCFSLKGIYKRSRSGSEMLLQIADVFEIKSGDSEK